MAFKYVFGPVASGRLGISLGVEMLGAPICSFDCLYCECGRTRNLSCERRSLVPAAAILEELAQWRELNPDLPDYITLGGMGEPTLNTEFDAVVVGIRELFPDTPVAVLTNTTTLSDPAVRTSLKAVDAVLPSMDTLVEAEFTAVNRPAEGLTAQGIAESLLKFRQEYEGKIYLEILLVGGVNDTEKNRSLLKKFIGDLRPDRVDVVTMSRPGAYGEAKPVSAEIVEDWRSTLSAQVRGPEPRRKRGVDSALSDEQIVDSVYASVRRRPQTADQLEGALAVRRDRLEKALAALIGASRVRLEDGFYYVR